MKQLTLNPKLRSHGRLSPISLLHNTASQPLLRRHRPPSTHIAAANEFTEEGVQEQPQTTTKTDEKDPHRYVDDTTDEDANMPDDPIDMDEEIIINQRAAALNIYDTLPHRTPHPTAPAKETITTPLHHHDDPSATSSSNVASSITSSDIEAADQHHDELGAFGFEGAGEAARQLKKEHDDDAKKKEKKVESEGEDEKSDVVPGSHESPQPPPAQHGRREDKMMDAEEDVTKMESSATSPSQKQQQQQHQQHRRSPSQLPGLLNEDTTFIPPTKTQFSDAEERFEGILEGIQKIAEDEQLQHASSSFSHPHEQKETNTDDDYDEVAVLDDELDDEYEIYDSDQYEDLGRLQFNFKADENEKKDIRDDEDDDDDHDARRRREMELLARFASTRQSSSPPQSNNALKRLPPVSLARIAEVAAGRAAIVGTISTIVSEVVSGQSVLSQLLGRYEGPLQVEGVVQQSRTAAALVVALSLALTAAEGLLTNRQPPSVGYRFVGLSPAAQLWGGRLAMGLFTVIVLYETVHSNRPTFPFWYLLP